MLGYACTLDDVEQLIRDENNKRKSDALSRIPTYTERLSGLFGCEFEPVLETFTIAPNQSVMNRDRRWQALNRHILELVSVSIDEDPLEVGVEVELLPTAGGIPPRKLRFASGVEAWSDFSASPTALTPVMEIVAWTGFKIYPGNEGWRNPGESVTTTILATTAPLELEVADADGMDADGFQPRFSPGNLLRIDDEMLRVMRKLNRRKVLALRAQRGTEAAEHVEDTPIQVWNVERTIRHAVSLWTHLSYSADGTYATVRIDGLGATSYPVDMPGEVANIIRQFQDNLVGVF